MSARDASAIGQPWEMVLADGLGMENSWDEATELASMIADECFPDVIRNDIAKAMAAHAVVALVKDEDWRRCIESLLTLHHAEEQAEVDRVLAIPEEARYEHT